MSSEHPQIDEMKDEIKQAIIEALTDGKPSDAFCKNWPAAAAILEELLLQIPNQNHSLKACINGVIFAGNEFFKKCGS